MACPFLDLISKQARLNAAVRTFLRYTKVSMGLTDRGKTAKNLVHSRKNWNISTVSRKYGKKELTLKEIVP